MFAHISRGRFLPEHSEEIIRVSRESLDALTHVPGCHRVTAFYDRASGWGFVVSLWWSEEQARDASRALADMGKRMAPYFAGEPGEG